MTGFILCRCVSERKPLNKVVAVTFSGEGDFLFLSVYLDNLLSSFVVNETFKNAVES